MDATTFQPTGGKVLLKRIPAEEKIGLLHIPDMAREKATECEVVAVGPGRTMDDGSREDIEVAIGNRVLIEKWGGMELADEYGEYLVHEAGELLAVVG